MGEVIEMATPEEQAYRRLREIHEKLVQAVMVTVDAWRKPSRKATQSASRT